MIRVLRADHVLPIAAEPIRDGAVAYDDGMIIATGPADRVIAAVRSAEVEELGAAIILPGLVNAHTHIEYATYGGFGDGLPFPAWLADHVGRRPRLAEGDVEAAAALGAWLALSGGTTTIGDASYSGAAVAAASAAGLRAVVHVEVFGGPDADPDAVVTGLAQRLDGLAADAAPLVELGISPHSPYSVAPTVMEAVLAFARAPRRRLMIHAAESQAELEAVAAGTGPIAEALAQLTRIEATGLHPIATLARAGALGPTTAVVHGVHVDEAEVAVLAASGAALVHCPRSNALLGCGIAPLRTYLDAGVPVALGTDSPASAIDLDLWAEMRAALFLARAREGRPEALTAAEVLHAATMGGAAALGLDDRVGALRPGYRADLLVLDLGGTPFAPVEDPVVAAVLGGDAAHVERVIVDGALRYRRDADAAQRASLLEAAAPGRGRMIDPR